MESVTYRQSMRKTGEAVMILFTVIFFLFYKIFQTKGDIEYIILIVAAVTGLIGVSKLGILAKKAMQSPRDIAPNEINSSLGHVIIGVLGVFSFYIFFVKGIYGMYTVFGEFSILHCLFRLLIIVLSYRLVLATSKLQTVYKSLETMNITRN